MDAAASGAERLSLKESGAMTIFMVLPLSRDGMLPEIEAGANGAIEIEFGSGGQVENGHDLGKQLHGRLGEQVGNTEWHAHAEQGIVMVAPIGMVMIRQLEPSANA